MFIIIMLVENGNFFIPFEFDAPRPCPRRNITITFGTEKNYNAADTRR